jgi:hypothetical protein
VPAQFLMYVYYSQKSKKKQLFAYYWLKRAERNGTDVTTKIESLSKTLKGKDKKRADLWLKLYRYPVWKKDKAILISADLLDDKKREPTLQTLGDYLRDQKVTEDDDLLTYNLKKSLAYFKGTRSKKLDRAQNIIATKINLRNTAIYTSMRKLREKRAYMVKEGWPAEFISLFDAVLDWQKALFQLDPNAVFSIF